MVFWHIGLTIAIVRWVFKDDKMDLRFLAAGAIVSDLVDKPIALLWFNDLQATALVGHTLLFAVVVMTLVVLLTRRGRPRRRWMAFSVGIFMHLFLDFLWGVPETLFWPFFGWDFAPADGGDVSGYLGEVFSNPWRWLQEATGVAYLVWLARRADLWDPKRRREFIRTGRIRVPAA